eukprot:6857889-Karenia_brevis.AAC.1
MGQHMPPNMEWTSPDLKFFLFAKRYEDDVLVAPCKVCGTCIEELITSVYSSEINISPGDEHMRSDNGAPYNKLSD